MRCLTCLLLLACQRPFQRFVSAPVACSTNVECRSQGFQLCKDGFCVLSAEARDDDGDGYSELAGDCDDADPARSPGEVDVCDNQVDDDCDGLVDNTDADRDGFVATACGGDDCDDANPYIMPIAIERCGDDVDQNCTGLLDDRDVDRDGFVDAACGGNDCNDARAAISPAGIEICEDGIDQDCEEEEPLYRASSGDRLCADRVDDDRDGLSERDGDCDDDDRRVFPGAGELCDFADNDCSGLIDDGLGDACPHHDYGGADLAWSGTGTLYGVHFNIGTFSVPSGATLRVTPYSTVIEDSGSLSIEAVSIRVDGNLDASGAGYGGGGGGGGGPDGGAGVGARGGLSGTAGGPANPYYAVGGPGGKGGGTFGGAQGVGYIVGGVCSDGLAAQGGPGGAGGYRGNGANGDSSTGTDVSLGSGGGGGSGGYRAYMQCQDAGVSGNGGGGGAGNAGGGRVILRAQGDLVINGSVRASGLRCGAQNGGNGGGSAGAGGYATALGASSGGAPGCTPSASLCGQGGRGGNGGGGGILLAANTIDITGRVESFGGGVGCALSKVAGGTVKLFAASITGVSAVSGGRVCSGTPSSPCANVP